MTSLLVSLNAAMALQEDRIRLALLTHRGDLPVTVPTVAAAVYGQATRWGVRHKVSDSEIEDIKILRSRGVSIKVLALHFGISQGLVSELARGVDRNGTGKRRYFSSTERFTKAS